MLTKTEDLYKKEIMKNLNLAKGNIKRIILAVESEREWKDIHTQTETAIFQLGKASRLLARYHLEICIIGKHQKMHTPIKHLDIKEIIKTYKYLN